MKTAIVTGGANGIGAAAAEWLARDGYRVVIGDIDASAAEARAANWRDEGLTVAAIATDMADETAINRLIVDAAAGGSVRILVNAAADLSQVALDGDVLDTDIAVWDRVYQVNFKGALLASRGAVPHLLKNGGGAIVNISSIQSLLGDHERVAYSAMKAALNSLTRSIATRFGKQGVRCNAVCPGPVESADPGRAWPNVQREGFLPHLLREEVGRPQELAELIGFLATERSSFINGQTINADGGFTAHMHYFMRRRG